MIDEQTDKRPVINTQNVRTPSEKLILPAASPSPDDNTLHGHAQHTIAMPADMQSHYSRAIFQGTPPQDTVHPAPIPAGPPSNIPYHATVTSTWHNDPAYKVLLAAIALVIITGIAFTVYAFNVFAQSTANSGKTGATTTQKSLTPAATPNIQPTFPAPGSTTGTPTVGPQPTISATTVPTPTLSPTAQATQAPANGNLTVQITNYPQQVSNNTTVQVTIQANKPGASVQLIVTYNAPPGFYGSTIQQTDNGGNATLSWHIRILTHGGHPVVAHLIAVARDQNGHIAQSQMITVQVTT